ncbi:MAG TPA: phosphate ABC transporter permease subunit PstC [Chloroflexota bacterium]|jgi:phosphate transport system permease protein|nr:phosphate ABC transporter permease subunit PstC [Chloroflexota bacterium]
MSLASAGRPRRVGASGAGADRWFAGAMALLAAGSVATIVALAALLVIDSWSAIERYGPSFVTTVNWDPVFEEFGAAHFVYGTLVTSAVALVLAAPVAIGAALFVAEYAPRWLGDPISFVVELLAVIPSIIYGLWGFFVLAPLMRGSVEPALRETLGEVPLVGALFSGPPLGKDYLVGGTILAIMILPTVMAIAREVFRAVPDTQREGMLALGATKWETIRGAVLPYARGGLTGAAGLGLARALGETMAVTMVIGNSSSAISPSLFTPGYTMASAIANQFTEADKEIYFSAIVEVALVLLLVATVVNLLGRLLVWRFAGGRALAGG